MNTLMDPGTLGALAYAGVAILITVGCYIILRRHERNEKRHGKEK